MVPATATWYYHHTCHMVAVIRLHDRNQMGAYACILYLVKYKLMQIDEGSMYIMEPPMHA